MIWRISHFANRSYIIWLGWGDVQTIYSISSLLAYLDLLFSVVFHFPLVDPIEITTERNHFRVWSNKHRGNRRHPRTSCKHCQMLGRHAFFWCARMSQEVSKWLTKVSKLKFKTHLYWCLLGLHPGEKPFGQLLGHPGGSRNHIIIFTTSRSSDKLGLWLGF